MIMLENVNIENIAIIEKACVNFTDGLNILTGETGAGKSILIDSINAVTGQKTSRELIRTGENSAEVSAFFVGISDTVKEKLAQNGIPVEEDGSLLLHRKLFRDGKNICRINGSSVTVSMLKAIGSCLIDIHGQRDSYFLLNSENHIDFLDSYAKIGSLVDEYGEKYSCLSAIEKEIKALDMDEAYKERRTDILTYQISELENADIKVGEKAALTKKKHILNNGQKLTEALKNALSALSGNSEKDGAHGLVSLAVSEISSVSSLAKGLDTLGEKLTEANCVLEDCSELLEDVLGQLESIDGNIDEIEERLDLIYRLSKKYGDTEDEMLSFLEKAKKELDDITFSSEKKEKLKVVYSEKLTECEKYAAQISEKRKKAAHDLCSAIKYELSFLDMPACTFFVDIQKTALNEKGEDRVEFLISANPGEEPKPINKASSGGELSRIMLAVKTVLNKNGGADTLIFDEIDSGVSGSAARRIAVKLSEVSRNSQVLCITHLAQIAAFADSHKFIYKQVENGKTYTKIKELSDTERPSELARISFGSQAQPVQLESAKQMILSANEEKVKFNVC